MIIYESITTDIEDIKKAIAKQEIILNQILKLLKQKEVTNGAWSINEVIFYRLACIRLASLPLNSQAGVRTMSDQLKRLKRKYPELSRIVFNFNKTNKENDGKRIEKMMSVKDHALYIKLTNSEGIKWLII